MLVTAVMGESGGFAFFGGRDTAGTAACSRADAGVCETKSGLSVGMRGKDNKVGRKPETNQICGLGQLSYRGTDRLTD